VRVGRLRLWRRLEVKREPPLTCMTVEVLVPCDGWCDRPSVTNECM
jgi:hypothetical protein